VCVFIILYIKEVNIASCRGNGTNISDFSVILSQRSFVSGSVGYMQASLTLN
jgi:hypothetical protein